MSVPLWAELKRRRVFRALIGYGVAAFAVLQIIEPIMHGLHWPDSVLSYVVAALAVGFPIVVSLAWIFDVNAGHIERTAPAPAGVLKGARLALVLAGIGALAAVPGVVWYFLVRGIDRPSSSAGSTANRRSIAVLPFTDLSPARDQEYFAEGIAEEILNALVQVDGLNVFGRTSSFSFKDRGEDPRCIGHKLGADAVLEGSVRKSGTRVRITAQLISTENGYHLWSQAYDRDLTDIFAVQEEIARAVVTAAKGKLLPDRAAVPQARRTANSEAYTQFLIGRQLYNRHTRQDYGRSVAAFERALALDPSYAPAHADLSHALILLVNSGEPTQATRIDAQRRAVAEAEKAVRLAPDLADAYQARGACRMEIVWDWDGARQDLERAIALAPGSALSRLRLGQLRAVLGNLADGITLVREAIERDPLDPAAWDFLGRFLAASGDLGGAREALQRGLTIAPDSIWIPRELGFTYLLGNRPDLALPLFDRAGGWIRLLGQALSQHDLGHEEEAQKALDSLMALPSPPAYQIAQIFARRGDLDRAFLWMERGRASQDVGVRYVKYDPLLQSLRGDSRYAAFLKAMNLPVG